MNDTKTVSGAIVHVTDADEAPLVKCLVDIEPKQSGSGTPSPSNVRPISGWESVSVGVSGKNLLDLSISTPSVNSNGITFTFNDDGTITANGTATGTAQIFWTNIQSAMYADLWSGKILNGCPNIAGCALRIERNSSPWTNYAADTGNGATIQTIPSDIGDLIFILRVSQGTTVSNAVFRPMIRRADDTDPTYEPYTGTTTTVNLGRTVYGGTLDVVTGVLTVDRAMLTFDGSSDENWSVWGTPKAYYVHTNISGYVPTSMISNQYRWVGAVSPSSMEVGTFLANTVAGGTWNGNISFKYDDGSDLDGFKASLAQNPIQVVYSLATPQTYTLTGQEISTLLGENNVWADSGDIEITYHTDTLGIYNKIYINGIPYFRPNDFEIKREDVYAGEYTTCTGKLIADKIGWKYSDLPMKWDILPDEDLVYLTTLTGAFDLIFRDSDGQHTEQVIRRAFTNTPTRTTGPEGTKIWTGVEMEVSFLNTHPINE